MDWKGALAPLEQSSSGADAPFQSTSPRIRPLPLSLILSASDERKLALAKTVLEPLPGLFDYFASNFVTYAADYNYSTKQPTPLREIGWNVNVNWDLTSTSNATNQMVTIPNPNDQAVTSKPVLDSAPTSSANYLLNNTAPTTGQSGTVMLP